MKKNHSHRPKNTDRIASMLRWYEAALADARDIDAGDVDYLILEAEPKPDMTPDRQFSLIRRWANTGCIDDIGGLAQDEREVLEWMDDLMNARKPPAKMRAYEIAAALFNNQLKVSQSMGYRSDEKMATPGAIQRAVNRYKRKNSDI
ncbi:MAG: hypothetical protein ACXV8I_11165 [Methylobacter sp.]